MTSSKERRLTPIRWTIERAASEFGPNPKTIAKAIKAHGIDPGRDGKWSTAQMCAACFGDLESEKLRKIKAESDLLELECGEKEASLCETKRVGEYLLGIFTIIRERLLSSGLSDLEKKQLITELQGLKDHEFATKENNL